MADNKAGGKDLISGTLGNSVSDAAVGKDIQTVHIDFGNKSDAEVAAILAEMQSALFGNDRIGLAGLMREIREMRQQMAALTEKVNRLVDVADKVETMSKEMDVLKERVGQYGGSSHTNQILLYIIAGVVIFSSAITIWQLF